MKHEMQIELSTVEGAMLRTVGLIERRGFTLQSCTLHDARDDRRLLDVVVESERPVQVLMRQLQRLHDVYAVELQASAQQVMKKVGMRTSMGSQR